MSILWRHWEINGWQAAAVMGQCVSMTPQQVYTKHPCPFVPLPQLHRTTHQNPTGAYGGSACPGANARWLRGKFQR